jgi:hypothetical protein
MDNHGATWALTCRALGAARPLREVDVTSDGGEVKSCKSTFLA